MTELVRVHIPWRAFSPELLLPLGRNVHHDPRSRLYPFQATAPSLVTALHNRNTPILDQGQAGSCTGNACTGGCGTDPIWAGLPAGHPVLDEPEALVLYSAAEVIDGDGPYPPNDNGSSGLSVCKAAQAAGLISGYTHTFDLNTFLAALTEGPVLLGSNWYDSMDSPDSSGLISVSANATVRGGHETLWRGIDVTKQQIFGDNSWGTGWGLGGSMVMAFATLERLLSEQGDGTVPVAANKPAPVPVAA